MQVNNAVEELTLSLRDADCQGEEQNQPDDAGHAGWMEAVIQWRRS